MSTADFATMSQNQPLTFMVRQNGMSGGGYIFSTGNCIYTGMRLFRYELMMDVWRQEGNYEI
jgi:hypothetical protein